MRKVTKKKFRRYDLILRNQNQACILDWKFSINQPDKLLYDFKTEKKNRDYIELAKKEYKTNVKLKYVVLTPQFYHGHYQRYQCEQYKYKSDEVYIEESDGDESDKEVMQIMYHPEDERKDDSVIEQSNNDARKQENRAMIEAKEVQQMEIEEV